MVWLNKLILERNTGFLLALVWDDGIGIPWCHYCLSPSAQFVQGSRSWQRSLWTSFSWNHTPYMTLNSNYCKHMSWALLSPFVAAERYSLLEAPEGKNWQTLDEGKKSSQFFLCKWISLFVIQRFFWFYYQICVKSAFFGQKKVTFEHTFYYKIKHIITKVFRPCPKIFGKRHH